MSSTNIPKSVLKIWKILIAEGSQYLTAQEIATKLKMQPNSVLQNVHRNKEYFDIINKKPVRVNVKPIHSYFLLRDKCNCIFCQTQLSKANALVDTLETPEKNPTLELYNAAVICKSCKSARYQPKVRHQVAEVFVERADERYDQKKIKKAIERIQIIRAIEKSLPITKRNFIDQIFGLNTGHSFELIQQITDLQEEITILKESLNKITKTKTYEYYEVNLYQLEDEDDDGEEFTYWGWDYDPDRHYPGGESDYWYFSQKKKVTHQGRARKTSLDEVLDHFGKSSYTIAGMKWNEDTQYNKEIHIIFQREV